MLGLVLRTIREQGSPLSCAENTSLAPGSSEPADTRDATMWLTCQSRMWVSVQWSIAFATI